MDIIIDADAPASNDFQDWEILQSSSTPANNNDAAFAPIDDDSPTPTPTPTPALLHPDYFALHPHTPPPPSAPPPPLPELDDHNSASSDNPSWIDPASSDDNPTRYLHKDPGGFWSDSSSEPSQDPKSPDFDPRNENDFPKEAITGEIAHDAALGFGDNSRVNYVGGADLHVQAEVCGEEENDNKSADGGNIADVAENKKVGGHVGKGSVVWWKMPMDLLKYCAFKISPVWAVSLAAAALGFVILGRKLYRMKKTTRGLKIKLTVDDKKISQVMNHANRLNDAFSIVKRVPMIRPSLPPPVGTATSWSMASLR